MQSLLLCVTRKGVAVLTLAPGIRIVVIRLVFLVVDMLVAKILVDCRLSL